MMFKALSLLWICLHEDGGFPFGSSFLSFSLARIKPLRSLIIQGHNLSDTHISETGASHFRNRVSYSHCMRINSCNFLSKIPYNKTMHNSILRKCFLLPFSLQIYHITPTSYHSIYKHTVQNLHKWPLVYCSVSWQWLALLTFCFHFTRITLYI